MSAQTPAANPAITDLKGTGQLPAGGAGQPGNKTGAHNLLFTNSPLLTGFSPTAWKGFLEGLIPKQGGVALSPVQVRGKPIAPSLFNGFPGGGVG